MILVADALNIPLSDKTVRCVVTSPPYWGLRDYGISGQLGLELTPEEYVDNMVKVFREVWRVLKDDGVLWLNLGDSYATGTTADRQQGARGLGANTQMAQDAVPRIGTPAGTKTKDLIGIPWRVAFALQADGWYLRSDIIWHKPNPMPESVKDRCTSSHEYIFMLTKQARYYYDADAIAEQTNDLETKPRKFRDGDKSATLRNDNGAEYTPRDTRNKRSVWTIPTKPYPEAHYAVFPDEIPKICILASTRPGDTVLDPFGGSGTTGKVAIELGRKAIVMDLSEDFTKNHMKKRMETTMGFQF